MSGNNRKKARCIMVQGTMSSAGKSLLCTALCRIFTQDGYSVAPFKSQNMALNSYITKDGLEMGRAQVSQAEACRKEPDVRMNPVLLKPSSDTGSQVIVMGEVREQMNASEYYKFKSSLRAEIMEAYNSLSKENDIIVIEGAGSPAEINLKENDIVNMGLAETVDAPVILVGDIDRGGVFAQLYGTCELLEPHEKDRIEGVVINKFRGDLNVLLPGLKMLKDRLNKKVLGVVPMVNVDIDEEDSVSDELAKRHIEKPIDIAVIRLPRISNFTDFSPLENHPLLGVRYVRKAEELKKPDMIIIPGTKSTTDDLKWLRESGIEAKIKQFAASGKPVLGVCGGYQMLGEKLLDPMHSEGNIEELAGIGLLPAATVFRNDKRRTRVNAEAICGAFIGAKVEGYEIHTGRTEAGGEAMFRLEDGSDEGCVSGNVFGTYLHGLFDTGELVIKLAELLSEGKAIEVENYEIKDKKAYMDMQYDMLADEVRKSLDIEMIYEIMDRYQGAKNEN